MIKYLKFIFLAAIIYFPIFGHLDSLPIRLWDESRLAINVLEMSKDGDWIVNHFEGKPDMWNTKPPLLLWIQTCLTKIMGPGELAMRIPSAVSAFLTCCFILFLCIRYLQNFMLGFIAVLVLITTQGYIELHCVRTGDYDATLILFLIVSAYCFFLYLELDNPKYLLLFFIALTLGVLTKGIVGLLMLPGLLIYSLFKRKFVGLFKQKNFYLGIFIFLFFGLGFYFLREYKNPGYILQVWENELGGRYLEVMENHAESDIYYFRSLILVQYQYYFLFIIGGMAIGLFSTNKRISNLTLFSSILLISFLIVISSSQTKLLWYDAPSFPILAILSAVLIDFVYKMLSKTQIFNSELKWNIIPFVFLFMVFIIPYSQIIGKTFKPMEDKQHQAVRHFYDLSYVLRDIIKNKKPYTDFYVSTEGYTPHVDFYYNILKDQKKAIGKRNPGDFANGDVIITGQDNIIGFIEKNFEFNILFKEHRVFIFKI